MRMRIMVCPAVSIVGDCREGKLSYFIASFPSRFQSILHHGLSLVDCRCISVHSSLQISQLMARPIDKFKIRCIRNTVTWPHCYRTTYQLFRFDSSSLNGPPIKYIPALQLRLIWYVAVISLYAICQRSAWSRFLCPVLNCSTLCCLSRLPLT